MSTETHSVPRDTAIPADKLYSHFKKFTPGKDQENLIKDLKISCCKTVLTSLLQKMV